MKHALGRILSGVLTAGGWALLGSRFVLDLIGYSTIPEDVAVAQTRLDQAIGFFLSIPWWALLGFALISTLWLMWVSWPRQNQIANSSQLKNEHLPAPETSSQGAKGGNAFPQTVITNEAESLFFDIDKFRNQLHDDSGKVVEDLRSYLLNSKNRAWLLPNMPSLRSDLIQTCQSHLRKPKELVRLSIQREGQYIPIPPMTMTLIQRSINNLLHNLRQEIGNLDLSPVRENALQLPSNTAIEKQP